jgi:hypothetical protein
LSFSYAQNELPAIAAILSRIQKAKVEKQVIARIAIMKLLCRRMCPKIVKI